MAVTTWRKMFKNDEEDPVLLNVAPNDAVLDVTFNDGYGGTQGPRFLAWSATHVYFPVQYDGAEWIGSAPRNPTDEGQEHVGGG